MLNNHSPFLQTFIPTLMLLFSKLARPGKSMFTIPRNPALYRHHSTNTFPEDASPMIHILQQMDHSKARKSEYNGIIEMILRRSFPIEQYEVVNRWPIPGEHHLKRVNYMLERWHPPLARTDSEAMAGKPAPPRDTPWCTIDFRPAMLVRLKDAKKLRWGYERGKAYEYIRERGGIVLDNSLSPLFLFYGCVLDLLIWTIVSIVY